MFSIELLKSMELLSMELLKSVSFWYFISFVFFLFIIARPVVKILLFHLDEKSKAIGKHLEIAQKSRQDAEVFLAEAKKQNHLTSKHVADMLERSRQDSIRIEEETISGLDSFLEREKNRAEDSIVRLEAESSKRIQLKATEISLKITKDVLFSLFANKDVQKSFNTKTLNELKKINNM